MGEDLICVEDGSCAGCSQLGHWCAARGYTIDCLVLVTRHGFDAGDRPPAGTGCAECKRLGHWCPAKGYSGEVALCLACGRGEACGQALSVEKMRSGFVAEEFEAEKGHIAEGRTLEITDADRVVKDAPAASDWAIKASLDPENLKRGLTRSARAPLLAGTAGERVSARVKLLRMDRQQKKKLKAMKAAKPEEVYVAKITSEEAKAEVVRLAGQGNSINAIANIVGSDWASVRQVLLAEGLVIAKPTVKKAKPGKKAAVATAVIVKAETATEEMVSVKVSAKALDRLILMLPTKMKAAAVEKLLAEL